MIPAPNLQFSAVAPLAFVSIGALVVLMGEVLLSRRETFMGRAVTTAWIGSVLSLISMAFLTLAVVVAGQGFLMNSIEAFNLDHPMMQLDRYSNFAIVVIGLASIMATGLSKSYLEALSINHGEYYALLLLATAGMILMVSATDLMTVFLGLEIMSIPIYALAGFDRGKQRSNESALKYFMVGSFASAVLLYGMALLYGATGQTHFSAIRAAFDPDNAIAVAGVGLILVGFAFKISAVPFHQWTPDVYEGAPTSVTAYMSVTVKVAAFVTLLRLLQSAIGDGLAGLRELLWVLAALTMVVGNVMAVIQQDVKRLLAYSSIAHAGYILIGLVAGTPDAHAAILFYLLVYVFMNLGAFGVVMALAHQGREVTRIDDFAGLARTRPGLAAVMTLFMLALAGIPGTAGFIAKFMLFASAVSVGQVPLVVIAVLTSVVSVYYYLRLPVVMYMREPSGAVEPAESSSFELVVLGLCTSAVLVLGIFPNGLSLFFLHVPRVLEFTRQSVALLR